MADTFLDLNLQQAEPNPSLPSSPGGQPTSGSTSQAASTLALIRPYILALLAIIAAIIAILIYQSRQLNYGSAALNAATELEIYTQRLGKAAQGALRGDAASFDDIKASEETFSNTLKVLQTGGTLEKRDILEADETVKGYLSKVQTVWEPMSASSKRILEMSKSLLDLKKSVESINAVNGKLLEESERLSTIPNLPVANIRDFTTSRLMMLTQRIAKNANAILASDAIDPDVALALGRDAITFQDVTYQLSQAQVSGENKATIERFIQNAQTTVDETNAIVNNIQPLVESKSEAKTILDGLPALTQATDQTVEEGVVKSYAWKGWQILALVSLVTLGLFLTLTIFRVYSKDATARRIVAERERLLAETDRNQTQQAILRLMNEMGDLADGNLTVRATVTEDITGAIADSVNYTVEELGVLVRRINDAATRVASASQTAQTTSQELILASTRQSQQLKQTGETVNQMAQAISETSSRALASAQVARQGLEAAKKGQESVQNTIRGMNEIREKIQETSKRIKRLGESSQEIGEIVDLISDITEQTNVLALNAAIQAASAGAAGRGFTVVAEEVQRLAERSAEATKQIGVIVKTIQTDTQDAVGAMEFATRDVVEGAQLSDSAGQALSEISHISLETARLIEQISQESQTQAENAVRVAETMGEILAITAQTSAGTQKTAESVGELAELASELKGSVSGFKV